MDLPEGVRRERIEPLWERVDRNRVKLAFFILAYLLSIALSAGVIAGAAALLVGAVSPALLLQGSYLAFAGGVAQVASAAALVIGSVWVAYAMMRSEKRLLRELGAVLTPTGEYMPTKLALKDMSLAAGFGHAPPLWVIPDCTRINAFAIGRTHRGAVIGVTQGFVDRLDEDEQRAVFANLMARLCNGDVPVATAVSALVGPLWSMRDKDLRRDDGAIFEEPKDYFGLSAINVSRRATSEATNGAILFLLYGLVVVLSEVLLRGHQAAALLTAEKADAEGMLLLKDPRTMLRALEKVLDANNTVPTAGEAYSDLFYCWAGFGYAPEDDPEYERIARLREVLGIEGLVEEPDFRDAVTPEEDVVPVAPYAEEQEKAGL